MSTTPTMLDAANTQAQAAERRRRIRQSLGTGTRDMSTPDLMTALAREILGGDLAVVVELLGELAARRSAAHHPELEWLDVAQACWDRLAAGDEEAG